MTELERRLRWLDVEWPETPALHLRLERRRRRRGLFAVALAAALAAAFAVPQSRSAILRFFDLGAVRIERVGTLPKAEERPLAAGLGSEVSSAAAAQTLGTAFRPAGHGTLYEQSGFVSTLMPGPVLLSEFGSSYLVKKLVTSSVEAVEIAPGVQGLWISGEQHVVFFSGVSPRLAGDVLVWEHGGITFRLEGHSLGKGDAVALARQILGTAAG